ncbi:class I SAM-dependent methyltransferase, partial [Candidatus Bathyarchaeota archaeon]|nr:class I SAM-dependent methyltransferase [Candidatus Bathyarchaeota archaeon]
MDNSSDLGKKGFAEGFWSKEEVKDIFLDEQRTYLFNEDYFRNILVPLFMLRRDSVVLDVGCGLGFLGMKLAGYVPEGKIIGVDLDPKLIEEARKRAESR